MNKSDIILIGVLLLIVGLIFGIFYRNNKKVNYANVYYDNNLVLKIDLSLDEKEYIVKGYNGDVSIKAGNGKIKVEEENSPLHICSKQGYISKSYESIICLPNKIVITFDNTDEDIDTVVK